MRISDWSSDVCSSDLRDVQIHLHDALLAPEVLDKDGEPCLQAFAEEPSILPQKGVLGCLLADRRSAANFPAAHIANEGVFNGVRIERSEDRRVGKEGVSKCRSRWSQYH